MFIEASAEYIPARVVDNEYFSRLTGRGPDWFEQRTGIRQRRRTAEGENANSMSIAAVRRLAHEGERVLADVDLIIGASYTPWDTIGTIAHVIQREFMLSGARAIYLSTACSSFIDSLDVAAAYLQSGRARKALIVAAEHNSLYSSDEDEKSGHLWGDGAAAFVVREASAAEGVLEVVDTYAAGLADRGRGPEGISLRPQSDGLVMEHGRDIFAHACREMTAATRLMLARNQLGIEDLRLLVPHQANKRIVDSVAHDLGLSPDRIAMTIDELGNTGCASVAITLHRNKHRLAPGEVAVLVTFGGGYSVGAALVRRRESRQR
jgi:3-oxoacyl-[acyl-carrier-protein] synthase III